MMFRMSWLGAESLTYSTISVTAPDPTVRIASLCATLDFRRGLLEPMTGLEPVTSSLPRTRSTY